MDWKINVDDSRIVFELVNSNLTKTADSNKAAG